MNADKHHEPALSASSSTHHLTDGTAARVARQAAGVSALLSAVCISVAALECWTRHAQQYFFLFDDFALVGQASRESIGGILALPLFGFYRPLVFLLTKQQAGLYGWAHPAGYMATSVMLHAINSALAGSLAYRLWRSPWAAGCALVVALCSPWASEAVFWASGAFDLWSTLGVLIVLHAFLPGAGLTVRSMALRVVGVVAGSVVGLFSKESAVVIVALVPLVWCGGQVRRLGWFEAVLMAILCTACAGYLAARAGALSTLGGAYGGWTDLMASAPVTRNVWQMGHAVLNPPAAHDGVWARAGWARLLGPGAAVIAVALLGTALWQWRRSAALVIALLVSLLPVAWVGVVPGSSSGGRVLYLPGLLVALLLGVGVDALIGRSSHLLRLGIVLACSWLGVFYVVSLNDQRAVWANATSLARTGVEGFRPWVGQTGTVRIKNLPFWFEEGPYVLKSYAFGYYYHPAHVPPVTATALKLAFVGGEVRVISRGPEPGVVSSEAANVTEITLPMKLE